MNSTATAANLLDIHASHSNPTPLNRDILKSGVNIAGTAFGIFDSGFIFLQLSPECKAPVCAPEANLLSTCVRNRFRLLT
jgi:hypothetical protein